MEAFEHKDTDAPSSNLGGFKDFYGKTFHNSKFHDVTEFFSTDWLVKSEQRLGNVDQTHPVLASGTLVLPKKFN